MTQGEIKLQIAKLEYSLKETKFRATGRTTRIVDKIIQELFNHPNEWVAVFDHYDEPNAHRLVARRVIDRLKIEHHLEVEINRHGKHGSVLLKLKDYYPADTSETQAIIQKDIDGLKAQLKKE